MEKDNEVKGVGNSYTTLYRINDARLGRWLSVDPKDYVTPSESPYASMENNPIVKTDPNGDCVPCWLALVYLFSLIFDSEFAEAPGSDNGEVAQRKINENHEELSKVNDGIQIITNPGNISKTGSKSAIRRVVSNQIKKKSGPRKTIPETPTVETSREARRKVMREQNIPTSQQPIDQRKNESGREYDYKVPKSGGGTKTKSVQQKTLEEDHPDHWEGGSVRTDPATGETRYNDHGSPKLDDKKSKVNYRRK